MSIFKTPNPLIVHVFYICTLFYVAMGHSPYTPFATCVPQFSSNAVMSQIEKANASKLSPDQGPGKLFLEQEYDCIREKIASGVYPEQYILFRQRDATGWGNQLRGLISAFNIALLTKRILLIDIPCYHHNFEHPQGVNFTIPSGRLTWLNIHMPVYYHYKKSTPLPENQYSRSPSGLYRSRARELWAVPNWKELFLNSTDLNKDIRSPVWIYSVGLSLDVQLSKNPIYSALIQRIYQTRSKYIRTMLIGGYLLKNPKKEILAKVEEMKKIIGLRAGYFTLQYRSFVDTKRGNRKEAQFIKCANEILSHMSLNTSQIYYTSDDDKSKSVMAKSIVGKDVVFLKNFYTHTAKSTNCTGSGYLDWFIIGGSSTVITTGTSYAVTAISRAGGTIDAYTTGSSLGNSRCSKMKDDLQEPEYDVLME
eukprot:TRINITY_DN111_c0_g2_i1.p1 TRINITY_DN111_c0_g2~~TRINITY_DN111_c0_g2_i1.p1  ORF type:complete len:422 (-),score=48.94 TRINITY_DN111_c0_g2_i1:596-1861(-)